jgi:hypothetical protein
MQGVRDVPYELADPDVAEDLLELQRALAALEAAAAAAPLGALDDALARRLSAATRAPAAALLAAVWSPKLAEPLQSASPALAAAAHAEALNGFSMADSEGLPDCVRSRRAALHACATIAPPCAPATGSHMRTMQVLTKYGDLLPAPWGGKEEAEDVDDEAINWSTEATRGSLDASSDEDGGASGYEDADPAADAERNILLPLVAGCVSRPGHDAASSRARGCALRTALLCHHPCARRECDLCRERGEGGACGDAPDAAPSRRPQRALRELACRQLEEGEVEVPMLPLLRALEPSLQLPAPLAQWAMQLLHATLIVSFPSKQSRVRYASRP